MGNVQSRQRFRGVALEAFHNARDIRYEIGGPRVRGAIVAYIDGRLNAARMIHHCTQLEANEFERLAGDVYERWVGRHEHLYRCVIGRDGVCQHPRENVHFADCGYFTPLPAGVQVPLEPNFEYSDGGYADAREYGAYQSESYPFGGGYPEEYDEGNLHNNRFQEGIFEHGYYSDESEDHGRFRRRRNQGPAPSEEYYDGYSDHYPGGNDEFPDGNDGYAYSVEEPSEHTIPNTQRRPPRAVRDRPQHRPTADARGSANTAHGGDVHPGYANHVRPELQVPPSTEATGRASRRPRRAPTTGTRREAREEPHVPSETTGQGVRRDLRASTAVTGDDDQRRVSEDPTNVRDNSRREDETSTARAVGDERPENQPQRANSPVDNFIGEFLEGDDLVAELSDRELR